MGLGFLPLSFAWSNFNKAFSEVIFWQHDYPTLVLFCFPLPLRFLVVVSTPFLDLLCLFFFSLINVTRFGVVEKVGIGYIVECHSSWNASILFLEIFSSISLVLFSLKEKKIKDRLCWTSKYSIFFFYHMSEIYYM